MSLANILQRRIKARKNASDDDEASSILQESDSEKPGFEDGLPSAESSEGGESQQQQYQMNQAGTGYEPSDTNTDTDTDTWPETLEDVTSISFGALAKAQETLGNLKRRRRDSDSTNTSPKKSHLDYQTAAAEPGSHQEQRNNAEKKNLSRSSKHAPAVQTSKKPVTRRRDVITTTKLQRRDPRFDPLGGASVDEERTRKNYAFLDTYRDSEMTDLRTALNTTKDEQTQSDLKRALRVMESRKKAQDAKDLRQGVVRAHRARERELVKQGKKPFYLKKAELQRRTLVERFEGLGEKQVDKVIERRRKKTAAKERKRIPEGRGGRGRNAE